MSVFFKKTNVPDGANHAQLMQILLFFFFLNSEPQYIN